MPIIHNPEVFWYKFARNTVVAGLLGVAALNFESQHQVTERPPTSEEYFDAVVPEQEVATEAVLKRFVYDDLYRKAEYAEERVFFDGSPETVATCQAAAVKLAEVSIGPVLIDCTP